MNCTSFHPKITNCVSKKGLFGIRPCSSSTVHMGSRMLEVWNNHCATAETSHAVGVIGRCASPLGLLPAVQV